MEKFTALEPTRLHASAIVGRRGPSVPQKSSGDTLVGSLPADLHIFILTQVAVPDIPSYSRCSRTTAVLARDNRIWEARWTFLGVEEHNLSSVLDDLEERAKEKVAALRAASPPTLPVESMDDEFGDFTSANLSSSLVNGTGDLFGAFKPTSINPSVFSRSPDSISRSKYIRAHLLLKSITSALSSPPHLILSALTPFVSASLKQQAKMLHLLSLFLSPLVQPLTNWMTLSSSLRSAIDRFDAGLLTAFDQADSLGDEGKMEDAAQSSWEVWGGVGDWEMGKVWAEKREIFYEQGRWDPVDNIK
jgi:recyclin-1